MKIWVLKYLSFCLNIYIYTLRSHSVLWVRSSTTSSVILLCTHRSHSIMYSQKSFCSVSQIKHDIKCHFVCYHSMNQIKCDLSESVSQTSLLTEWLEWVCGSDLYIYMYIYIYVTTEQNDCCEYRIESIDWFWLRGWPNNKGALCSLILEFWYKLLISLGSSSYSKDHDDEDCFYYFQK